MMRFKQTEELSRSYDLFLLNKDKKDCNLKIEVAWDDNEEEWFVRGSSGATYTQCELEEMLRIVTSLNKEKNK